MKRRTRSSSGAVGCAHFAALHAGVDALLGALHRAALASPAADGDGDGDQVRAPREGFHSSYKAAVIIVLIMAICPPSVWPCQGECVGDGGGLSPLMLPRRLAAAARLCKGMSLGGRASLPSV